MKIIFGLGNPGGKYKNNRHNAGFMVADELARKQKAVFRPSLRFGGRVAVIEIESQKAVIVKPSTFLNNSGVCARKVLNRYRLGVFQVLIVYDDVDLPLGIIRLKEKGSAGGHNGLTSVIEAVGTNEINRLRIGVNRAPEGVDTAEYVLSDFTREENSALQDSIERAASACVDWFVSGPACAMNKYNTTRQG